MQIYAIQVIETGMTKQAEKEMVLDLLKRKFLDLRNIPGTTLYVGRAGNFSDDDANQLREESKKAHMNLNFYNREAMAEGL